MRPSGLFGIVFNTSPSLILDIVIPIIVRKLRIASSIFIELIKEYDDASVIHKALRTDKRNKVVHIERLKNNKIDLNRDINVNL